MKNWLTTKLEIDETNVDFSLSVPIPELMKFFEVATFKHSNLMGLDHIAMEKNSNAFWVVTKMKVIPKNKIVNKEKINITTWTHELGTARALRDCVIKCGNSVKAKFTAEWCCLDLETRRIRKMSTINYPNLDMQKTNNLNLVFTNMRENVDNSNFVYTKIIRSTDIDVNNHTNNLRYNYMTMDAFTVEELKQIDIKEYEIYFVNESYENDKIDVYKKKIKNYFYVEGKIEDKTIFKSVIKFKKKKER